MNLLLTKTLKAMQITSMVLIMLKLFITAAPVLCESTETTFSSMAAEKNPYSIPKVFTPVKIDAILDDRL